ncbi:MAG: hypothetical protein AABX54_02010 [Nanoarchaeota archaeon]
MPFDKIPKIDWGVVDTHNRRYSPEKEFQRFKRELEEHLGGNEVLGGVINALAHRSSDPDSVYDTAFTLIDIINAQREVDELNEMAELEYDGRRR